MSSAQSLREFITERLTAAAAEIFSEFEKTIVRYEEKIDRQRRLLELSWKPQLDLHRIELPLHDVRKDEEVQMGQQLWNQERTSSLDQEQAEHPLVKVEQDEPEPLQILEQGELSISQEDEEQFVLKQEMITSLVTPADEERDQNEPEPDTHQLLFSLFPETETRTAAPPGSTESTSMTSFPEQSELLSNESSDYQETVILTERPSSKRLRLDTEAKHLVNSILIMKPGGERIINEYNRFKSLSDETRRKMVNILVAHMTEKNGTSPHREVKAMYARGIVSLFPNLSDPFSRTGYEHYYDSFSGTGYLAWRIKTLQRSAARGRRSSFGAASEGAPREDGLGGPAAKRDPQFVPETVLSEDECKNAIALIKHSADEDTIKKMMKLTFDFRRNIVLDPEKSNNILSVFPRFRDVKGLVEQDFVLMFGDDVSSNFLEKWTSTFKKKIIQQCRRLPSTSELENLLLAADSSEDATEVDYDTGTTTQPIDTSTLPSSPLHHTEFAQEQSQFGQSYTAPRPPIPHALDPHLSPTPVHQLSRPPHEDGHQGHVFRPSSRLGKTGCASIPCSAAELHILTLLEHIKQQQMQLAVTVNSLAAGRGTETPVPEMPNVNLPLSTLSEVEEFEEWLKHQANARAKQNMVSVLGAVGGQNPKKTTWNILSKLFSHAVAKQINWKGVNGKKCFKEMITRSLLIRAVRKNPSSACAVDTEIDCFAIRWFNLASDRGGGRKERQKAKEAST